MQTRQLGTQGLTVSAIGLGCMGMSFAYGPANDEESLAVLRRAVEIGVNCWDTAEAYGPFDNEKLLGRALQEIPREQVVIATKFAFKYGPNGERLGLDSSPAQVKKAVEGSLRRLGTDYIDLIYQHRLDPNTPIEDTVGAMAELVQAGKARYLGLSEVGPNIIRRAHAIHPIAALQSEFSLWERSVANKTLPTLRELGIGFVAYSPLGRGFLTGNIRSLRDLGETDWRRGVPRFQEENLRHNLALVTVVKEVASENSVTPGQVALAWLLRQGPDIVPIPGTRHISYLEDNAQAAEITLPDTTWVKLDQALAAFQPQGARYPEQMQKIIEQSE